MGCGDIADQTVGDASAREHVEDRSYAHYLCQQTKGAGAKLQGEIFEEDESGHQPDRRGNSKKQQWGEVKQGASPSRTGPSSGQAEFDQPLVVACARFERS